MELIRLFYDSLDIKPKVLLSHFLHYLGFYVEEITGITKPSNVYSIADIYIISNYFMENKSSTLNDVRKEKTILICKDGWEINNGKVYGINYEKYNQKGGNGDKECLNKLVSYLIEILSNQSRIGDLLSVGILKLGSKMKDVISLYSQEEILQLMLYNRCFYKQYNLCKIALEKYKTFITKLEQLQGQSHNDLINYIITYAKFELNLICKKNSKIYYYPVDELNDTCLKLLNRYPENEQIRILQADIHFEIEDRWAWAANEYGDVHLFHCAYANYKRGRILRNYAQDYESAYILESYAVKIKSDYFAAWYQIAMCLEVEGRYSEAIDALERICEILNKKYQKHLLAPIELEYLYKTTIKIVQISEVYLNNYMVAQAYEQAADRLKKEVYRDDYLDIIWPSVSEKLRESIRKVIKETLEFPYEKCNK